MQVENELHKKRVMWAINPSLPTMFNTYRERSSRPSSVTLITFTDMPTKKATIGNWSGYTSDMDED